MKIISALLLAVLTLVLAGCAAPTLVRGSDPGEALARQSQSSSRSSDIVDYRQVLADPGPF